LKKLPLFLFAFFLAACSVELAPPENDSKFVPLVPTTTQSCDDCTRTQCSQYSACENSVACVALGACIATCTTPSCQEDCYAQHPEAYDLYFQLVSCSYQSCSNECATAACSDCERTSCGTQRTACISDVNCIRHWYCTSVCQDEACYSECDGNWSDTGAPEKLDAYMSCSITQCSSTCQ
jgi:hypothetical protein